MPPSEPNKQNGKTEAYPLTSRVALIWRVVIRNFCRSECCYFDGQRQQYRRKVVIQPIDFVNKQIHTDRRAGSQTPTSQRVTFWSCIGLPTRASRIRRPPIGETKRNAACSIWYSAACVSIEVPANPYH